MWRNEAFQFTCLPQGLSSAPRTFTKLLKPVLAHLRKLGITVSCYIDDCIFIAASIGELKDNVRYAVQLFDSVGLTVNLSKSVLVPMQEVEFLGILLNSLEMTATLPLRRKDGIKKQDGLLLKGDTTLYDLAAFIGLAVASDPAVTLAPLRYKYLEIIRNKELVKNKGNYLVKITLDDHAKELITWWVCNIDSQSKSLRSCHPRWEVKTDACLTGWGAVCGIDRTGDHWAQEELDHINCLELKAILLELKSLCKDHSHTGISIRSDNATVIAYLTRGGSTKFGLNSIDLFASGINTQVPTYVSWKPDPNAAYTNAFTMDWNDKSLYALPPFSVIGKMLKKIQEDKATVIYILPLWPMQIWFPLALQLLAETPLLLPRELLVLPQDPGFKHPQATKLKMTSMILSGNRLRTRAFQRRLPDFSLRSWRRSTKLQYGPHISRWVSVCVSRKIYPILPPLNFLLEFLLLEFKREKGRGYSTMNTIRSATSAIATIADRPAGQHPLVR
ncbi:uncharacterized protein LOC123514122 [Portunus trituberculatus]|uniref:uncharacterized protein LOC123514122 n=1 Tax=Portunus trituberculatus TaxID=210409 RepID=UPI001E1D19C1|nr:uncharacterized protein LOC123514122 [Portunus trituberculatus]